jgi:hypothetical protein
MLDLAVASFAGAHCSDFLMNDAADAADALSTDEPIALLAPFKDCSDELKKSSVTFRRCNLQCLDAFHLGRGVWVFCPPNCEPSLPLYISATIDSFSDIWGPLWKLKDQDNPDKCSAYVVGSGSIVQWEHNEFTSPELIEERFCHWISNEELENGTDDALGRGMKHPYIPFTGKEKLLIGAPTDSSSASVSPEPWTVNQRCSVPISKIRTQLREAGRLCIVGASKPYHYNDSNQYQLQVGYSGVNVSATRQYKRVPGQSLKDILIELWAMEPEIRDPRLLEDLHGVEVSMCTYNAQRVSLAQILRLECMHHLLRDFSWQDPGYCTEHFLTLEDTLRPKRLLDALFKEKFDYAVMLGLKMLSKTGVDKEDNLQVFLSSICTPKPELATMISKEHSWIGLLKDTATECAMVAFGESCLEFRYHKGVLCGRTGHSALLSAIIPHFSTSILHSSKFAPLRQDELERSPIATGKTFSLGERGALRLKSNLGGSALVMGWSPYSVKMALRSKLGSVPVHREYTEIDHSEEGRMVKPVPIIVMSDRSRETI